MKEENKVRQKIKILEENVRKQEENNRRKIIVRRGRKKESERGILRGEQEIGKFLIKDVRIQTPKRKKLQEEEKDEIGSERKRRKMEERKPVFKSERERKKEGQGVKELLGMFEQEIPNEDRKIEFLEE